jgi:hypothetical protein
MIRFECPACGAERKVSNDLAGQTILCDNCEERSTVPEPGARKPRTSARLVVDIVCGVFWIGYALLLFMTFVSATVGLERVETVLQAQQIALERLLWVVLCGAGVYAIDRAVRTLAGMR